MGFCGGLVDTKAAAVLVISLFLLCCAKQSRQLGSIFLD